MPELPLSVLDMTWSADERVVCSGTYPQELAPPHKGLRVAFDNVHAFMMFEEYSDPWEASNIEFPALATPVPYGGCWPFVEMVGSSWLLEVARRNPIFASSTYKHLMIVSRNHTLHIMAPENSPPAFLGWLS
jgi:hypothetical protein